MESSHLQQEQKQVTHYLPGVLFSSSSSTIADPDAGISTCATVFQVDDWYDNQFIQLKNGALQWKEIVKNQAQVDICQETVQMMNSYRSY